jgi:hypothetical protein
MDSDDTVLCFLNIMKAKKWLTWLSFPLLGTIIYFYYLNTYVEFEPILFQPGKDVYENVQADAQFYKHLETVLSNYHEPYKTDHAGKILIKRKLKWDKELVFNYTSKALDADSLQSHRPNADIPGVIIDPIQPMPFEIEQEDRFAALPVSLGKGQSAGFAVVNLYIHKNAVIDSFKIVKLIIHRNGETIVDYYLDRPLDNTVRQFYPILSGYLRDKVKVNKNSAIAPDNTTRMELMIRFK